MFSSHKPARGNDLQDTQPTAGDDVADRAMAFAAKYGTGMTPPVYQVWYTYAAREHPVINQILDTAMNTDQPLSNAFMVGLYAEHLSPRAMSDELHSIGSDLTNTLGSVGKAMEENLRQHSAFTGTLRLAKQSLAVGSSKQEVSDVIKKLHKANQSHLQSAQRLNMQLEKNRAHVSKLKGELIEAKRAANTDYLTGLPNRRLLDETLDQRIFDARHRTQPLAVMMAAIDNMESVTRDFGVSVGDDVMRRFAHNAVRHLGADHMIARFAGAKFALVLPGAGASIGFAVAEQIRKHFKSLGSAGEEGQALRIASISFGGTVLRDGDTRDSLIDRSDRHLAAARNEGHDRTFIT